MKVYYGPVYFRRESEPPNMTLSVAGTRLDAGVSVAEVSLKLVWEVIWLIKAGEHGVAYVLDAQDRVIAHSDMYGPTFDAQDRGSLHLDIFQRDFSNLAQVQASRAAASVAAVLGPCPATDPEPERRAACFTAWMNGAVSSFRASPRSWRRARQPPAQRSGSRRTFMAATCSPLTRRWRRPSAGEYSWRCRSKRPNDL
jgi:hypothetical protein